MRSSSDELLFHWVTNGLDAISLECRKRSFKDNFKMDCPFCLSKNSLEICCDEYTAAGQCATCGNPVHIKWDQRSKNTDGVKQIRMEGISGYVPPDYEYRDILTITDHSIEYQCTPSEPSEKNPVQYWSYTTVNTEFAKNFELAVDAVYEALDCDLRNHLTDLPSILFQLTLHNGKIIQKRFEAARSEFNKCKSVIKKLVPNSEPIPWVLKTEER